MSRSNRGFTLIEVMVSVAILALVVGYLVQVRLDQAKQDLVQGLAAQVMTISNIATSYYGINAAWPSLDNQSANACADLQTFIVDRGFLPADVEMPLDVQLTFNCADTSVIGNVLKITIDFGRNDSDSVALLLGYLPSSTRIDDKSVLYYVAPPRKLASAYQFYKRKVNGAKFTVPKPECAQNRQKSYILLPQAVCITNSSTGLGGFYFRETTESNNDQWGFELLVAAGDNNNSVSDFRPVSGDCGGEAVYVGAITYCDTP